MGKLKTFFHVLVKSFTSPAYYKELVPVKFSFSLKYFYLFFFFYAVIGTLYVGLVSGPNLSRFVTALPDNIRSLYPDELEIVIKNGEVTTNVVEPYAIPFSRLNELFAVPNVLGDSTASPENLVVIDTKGDVENFASYKTLMLVTKKSIVAVDDQGGSRLFTLDSNMSFTINKAGVTDVVNKFKPWLSYFLPGLIAVTFLSLFLFTPSGYMFYLLFFAFCLWLLSKITKVNLSYVTSYKLGLHLCTITAALFGVLGLLRLYISFPFLQTIILLVFSFFALKHMSPAPAAPASPPQTPTSTPSV